MKSRTDEPTLTDIQRMSGLLVASIGANASNMTARSVPYAESYRERSAVIETPIERLLRAGKEHSEG